VTRRVEVQLPAFADVYGNAVQDVLRFVSNEQLRLVAKHNPGWGPGRFEVEAYLNASAIRYANVIEMAEKFLHAQQGQAFRLLDVGGFYGAFALAMCRMGWQVTLSEKYSYYGTAFDELRTFLESEGASVWDEDLTAERARLSGGGFALVTILAVLEHLPHSPKVLMENVVAETAPGGLIVVEVPNIAYWPKRLQLLRGQTVHPPLRDVYDAEIPFTGHHREYTSEELTNILEWMSLDVKELRTLNYTPWPKGNWKQRLLLEWPIQRFPGCREVIMACARKARN
jgi:2-polyprenyl-3-methyl-5-hydroxy-6-metoxy-1,4-benzoquinol methylase